MLKDEIRKCEGCDKDFTPLTWNSTVCTKCRSERGDGDKRYIRAWKINGKGKGGVVGTLSELKVAIDMMSRGFEIYRNVSAHGSVDLIAYRIKDNELIAVEVTSGYVNKYTDRRYFPEHKIHRDRIDVVAVNYYDTVVYYVMNGDGKHREINIDIWKKP